MLIFFVSLLAVDEHHGQIEAPRSENSRPARRVTPYSDARRPFFWRCVASRRQQCLRERVLKAIAGLAAALWMMVTTVSEQREALGGGASTAAKSPHNHRQRPSAHFSSHGASRLHRGSCKVSPCQPRVLDFRDCLRNPGTDLFGVTPGGQGGVRENRPFQASADVSIRVMFLRQWS